MAGECRECGAKLTSDEIAIYRRLIDRDAGDCLCADCLAAKFKCPRSVIDEKIAHFKEMGCMLFC
jgi:hypothetical protein